MPKFNIPEPFREGFYYLARLKKTDAKFIGKVLSSVKIGEGPEVISKKITDTRKIENVKEILITVFSLTGLIDSEKLPLAETIQDLVTSYKETNEPKLSKERTENLETNLVILLKNNELIRLTFKAHSISGEYQKILTKSKVLSDVRFIFSNDVKHSPKNSLIIHQLKVEYRENNQTKESYYALDRNDLEKLKKDIDRALEKEDLIRDSFGTNISFIDPKE